MKEDGEAVTETKTEEAEKEQPKKAAPKPRGKTFDRRGVEKTK